MNTNASRDLPPHQYIRAQVAMLREARQHMSPGISRYARSLIERVEQYGHDCLTSADLLFCACVESDVEDAKKHAESFVKGLSP